MDTGHWNELWRSVVTSLQSVPQWTLMAVVLVVILANFYQRPLSDVPVLNPIPFYDPIGKSALLKFVFNARKMLHDWFEKNPDKPVLLNTDTGSTMVLPGSMAHEIRNDKRFHLRKQVEKIKMMHGHLEGFEVFRDDKNNQLVKMIINRDLTKQLSKVTAPLAEETSLALMDLLGRSEAWQVLPFQSTILQLVARLSSRVFLGAELCRDETWLQITKDYAVMAFMAAQDLRMWPIWLRPIANLFLDRCRKSRALMREARKAIEPVLQERARVQGKSVGEASTKFEDAITWLKEAAGTTPYDPQIVQLSLSTVAVHTTTDLLCQSLKDILQHPVIIQALRKEMIAVLTEDQGLKTTSLTKMKLLDSCIKESQRLKPLSFASMGRVTTERVVLSNGTVIPKGQSILVDASSMWDPAIHPHSPTEWDGHRFLRMREDPQKRDQAQLVSTSSEHIAFGYGAHACPGRFFAANEIKIALTVLLLQYDVKLQEDQTPKTQEFGFMGVFDSSLNICVKSRKAEVNL